jgi:hypothetical protein
MTSQQIEDERRQGRIAGIAAIAGIVIFIAAMGFLAVDFNGAEEAEQLSTFDSVSGDVFVQCLLQAIALLLFTPALVSFFRSVQWRSETVRPGLVGIVVASPIMLALALFLAYFAYKSASDAFTNPPFDLSSNDDASEALSDQFTTQLRTGLGLAGSLGLAFVTVYLALHAMRSGLISRFWGTLAMAMGVGTLLFGSVMLLAYMIIVALLIAGWWPSGRPPAWAAGEAIPWPKPGEPGAVAQEDDDLAAPEDFEGTATEVEPSRPGRRDNKRKRKRKQRG